MKLEGIHHITAVTGDAQRNVDFYARVLGLRMVKKTVNQDDPTVYHLFYADEKGSPGADLTFFEYPGAPLGRAGDGMVHRIVWRVGASEALDFWSSRLADEGVEPRREGDSLVFADPEGLEHELHVVDVPDAPLIADHPEVPREHALQGFDGVRAYASDPEASRDLLEEALGFEARGDVWELRGEHRGGWLAYDAPPAERGLPAAGTVHHVAWASRDEDQEEWRARATRHGARADAGDRPLLVPLGLLPRAQRRAVRDRHARAGLLHRRGPRAPGREARAAAPLREPARAHRGHADARGEPARSGAQGMTLTHRERPAAGAPEGALLLLHGRGADENDLYPLLDVLDPERRLLGATARAPLSLPPGGAHWYAVHRVGYPDPDTFWPTWEQLTAWADGLLDEHGIDPGRRGARRLLPGHGDVLRARARAQPAAAGGDHGPERVHAHRGGLRAGPGAGGRACPWPSATATRDPVISVDFARSARERLEQAGAEVTYQETPMGHQIDPRFLATLPDWVAAGAAA